MTETGLSTFDKTLQTSNEWLNEIEDALHLEERQQSYHALRGVLLTLRDRLPVDEAMDLAAELPMLIRGVYFEGYKAANKPEKYNADEFLGHVKTELQAGGVTNAPNEVARCVFEILSSHISEGEARQVRNAMPGELKGLWPN